MGGETQDLEDQALSQQQCNKMHSAIQPLVLGVLRKRIGAEATLKTVLHAAFSITNLKY